MAKLEKAWGQHRASGEVHFILGPYGDGSGVDAGYQTLCGHLSGARGWNRTEAMRDLCSRCLQQLASARVR